MVHESTVNPPTACADARRRVTGKWRYFQGPFSGQKIGAKTGCNDCHCNRSWHQKAAQKMGPKSGTAYTWSESLELANLTCNLPLPCLCRLTAPLTHRPPRLRCDSHAMHMEGRAIHWSGCGGRCIASAYLRGATLGRTCHAYGPSSYPPPPAADRRQAQCKKRHAHMAALLTTACRSPPASHCAPVCAEQRPDTSLERC